MRCLPFLLMWVGLVNVVLADVAAELLDHIPVGANVLVVVDVAQLFGDRPALS